MHRLDKESTIYNFTLIRKIRHHPLVLIGYGIVPIPIAIYLAISLSPRSLLGFVIGVLLLPVLYSVLAGLNLRLTGSGQRGNWSFIWRFPWIGLLPDQYFPLRVVTMIHHQLLWIGLAAVCCLYPWLSMENWLPLLALHLWYLLPRYWIFFLLRRAKKPGLLKINSNDTSYYIQ